MIGKMVASEPEVDFAALFYKPLGKVKDHQHRINKGNFDCYMKLPKDTKCHIQWWIDHSHYAAKAVILLSPQYVIFTDAWK